MSICFATCETNRAIRFINKMYPNHNDLTNEDIPLLINLIDKDILRVQDPDFHQPCQIVSGKKYDSMYDTDIQKAINQFKETLETKKIN